MTSSRWASLCAVLLLLVGAVLPHGASPGAGPAGKIDADRPADALDARPTAGEITADGAWCWFADPRALSFEGDRASTFVGWVTSDGRIQVGRYDHETGETIVSTVRERGQRNDHASPALVVRPDGRIVVFYALHRGDRIYYRVSENPEDISSWGDEGMIGAAVDGYGGYTYPNPIVPSSDDDRALLFFRGPGYQPTFVTSDDGVTWRTGGELLRGGERPYVKLAADGTGTVHLAFTDGHPRDESGNSIHYVAFDGESCYRADGTQAAAGIPLDPVDADLVYDGHASGAPSWVWDIALDEGGRPVIVYAVFPEGGEHGYRYARWDGARWRDVELTTAGRQFPTVAEGEKRYEPHYSGGVVLDHGDPSMVYLSRPVDGVFEIERWETTDGGASWCSEPVTSGSDENNVRPCVPRDRLPGSPRVLWMHGEYGDYADFGTSILLDPGGTGGTAPGAGGFESTGVVMKRVFRWERERLAEEFRPDAGWVQSVFMAGVVAAWEATGDADYLDTARAWAEGNAWRPGPRPRHADDHCSAQTYLRLLSAPSGDIGPTRSTFDEMLADPLPGREEWSWCDALFMAPPAMAMLSDATGDARYLNVAVDMWWDTHALLYDSEDALYHRDTRAMRRRDGGAPLTMRGNKLFWSRGNGWVLAGLARVLSHMPERHGARDNFERLFRTMAARLAELQPEDGLWRSALLDPPESQPQEASGTALFCYAMAWGVNAGLLDAEEYVPVVERAWRGLVASVDGDGRLGWVQGIGSGPALTERGHSAPYGAGALLLAGSEMLKLDASRREH